jgi:HD-GYP domain-containing protein (c-di-GMP phosphodiesterase class II)
LSITKRPYPKTSNGSGAADEMSPLERERHRLEALSTGIAQALINAMEAKSPFLRGHSERVAACSAAIAAELDLGDDLIEQIRLAGRLHDVGKIGIREEVLNKPGALTEEEFAHVRDHVRISLDILSPLSHLGPVLDFVRDHHERRDGSGYPNGLKGDAITLGGRIVGAADVFDALTSPRAYRDAMSRQRAIEYLEGLDLPAVCPTVFPALARVVASGKALVFLDEA